MGNRREDIALEKACRGRLHRELLALHPVGHLDRLRSFSSMGAAELPFPKLGHLLLR